MSQLTFIENHIKSNDYSVVSLQEVPYDLFEPAKRLLESNGFTIHDFHIEDNLITLIAINSINIEPFIKELDNYSIQ